MMKTTFIKRLLIMCSILLTIMLNFSSCSSSDDSGDNNNPNPIDPVGEVSGMVSDEDGNIYDNVRIHLKEGSVTLKINNTNENGVYSFSNVGVGSYNIEIELPLSTSAVGSSSKQVSVQNNATATADFTIKTNSVQALLVLGDDDFLGEVRNAAGNVPSSASELLFAVNVFTNQGMVPLLGPDGTQVTLGQWDNAEGTAEIYCDGETTYLEFSFSGLLPEGAYTLWVGPMNSTDILGTGALGDSSGSDNVLDVDAAGNAEISMTMDPGSLSVFGLITSCLLTNQTDIVLILDYHIDGQTHGGSPGSDTTDVGHLLFFL